MSTNQALTFRPAEASDAPVNLMKSLQEQHHLSLVVHLAIPEGGQR